MLKLKWMLIAGALALTSVATAATSLKTPTTTCTSDLQCGRGSLCLVTQPNTVVGECVAVTRSIEESNACWDEYNAALDACGFGDGACSSNAFLELTDCLGSIGPVEPIRIPCPPGEQNAEICSLVNEGRGGEL